MTDLPAEDESKYMAPVWAMEISASLAFVISIIGFLGNMLTILALPFTRKLRTAATWFVLNLAATEMLFCVTILPMSAAHLLHLIYTKDKLFDNNGCRFFVFLRYIIVQAELLSIAAIALNRCILIAFPKKYASIFNCRRTTFIIFSIWVYSIVIMVFPLTGVFGSFAYNMKSQECDFQENEILARKIYLYVGFLFPCVIIVFSYSYIFYKAKESAERIRARTENKGLTTDSSEANRPAKGLRNRDMRIARTIGVIFLAFLICCIPVSIAHLYGSDGQIPTLLLLLHPLYWLQYCVNIFIYVLMNKQYRIAYINYIGYWFPSFKRMLEENRDLPDEETNTSFSPGKNLKRMNSRNFFRSLSRSSSDTEFKLPSFRKLRKWSESFTRRSNRRGTERDHVEVVKTNDANVVEDSSRNRKVSFKMDIDCNAPSKNINTDHFSKVSTSRV